jgi:predicted transcriptional regulator
MTTRNRTYRLGDLQLQIMKILWRAGPLGVAEVHAQLKGEPLAYTTVATMLRKMEVRQLVRHRQEGRRFVYEPLVDSQEVTRSMATDLVDRLFAGSLTDAMSHLLETRDVSRRELVRLEQLIEERKRRK